MRPLLFGLAAALLTAGCMTSESGSRGVFPCVWSDNGCAFYPLYYQSTTDRGQTETYWMLCGLTGWRTHRGELKTDWLVPLYARGPDWFASIPYTTIDDGVRANSQFWLGGLGGRIVDARGELDRHWVLPFYYRDRELLATPFYGKSKDAEWIFPLYCQGKTWSANLLYARKDDEVSGEHGWFSPWILTKSDWTAGGCSDFLSPLFGWLGEGTSQTNRWWATPLVGTRSGRATGWWAFPLYSCRRDGRFDERAGALDGETIPGDVTFPEETVVDVRGGTSVRRVQKGSVRADDESSWFVFFDNDGHVADAYSPKTGRYSVTGRRKFGNSLLLGRESWREVLFDAAGRQKLSERSGSSVSLLWRLFRHESVSDGESKLYLFFCPIY